MAVSSSPSKLYIALIILVGIGGGYVMYSQWIKPAEEVIPPPVLSNQGSLPSLQNLKIDFSALDSVGLVINGESPVNPGPTGKADIFAP